MHTIPTTRTSNIKNAFSCKRKVIRQHFTANSNIRDQLNCTTVEAETGHQYSNDRTDLILTQMSCFPFQCQNSYPDYRTKTEFQGKYFFLKLVDTIANWHNDSTVNITGTKKYIVWLFSYLSAIKHLFSKADIIRLKAPKPLCILFR